MNYATSNSKSEAKDSGFDYFYTLLKGWKTITLVCLVFLILGVIYLFALPQSYTTKSTFSISLNKSITTSYGKYILKTRNPLHYLTLIEQKQFKDSVFRTLGVEKLNRINFDIEEEKILVNPKGTEIVLPNKFSFFVSGNEEDQLVDVNNRALEMFLNKMDNTLSDDMYEKFSSELKISIDELKLAIEIKEKLIKELKESHEGGIEIKTDKTNYQKLIDDRLINSLEGTQRGLIISMMLNADKGNQYYQETVLAVEEVQLKVSKNYLEKKELLLAKLTNNKENNTLSKIFGLPFSNNYLTLTTAENVKNSDFIKDLKKVAILLVLVFFITTTGVIVNGYYKFKFRNK